MGTFTVTVEIGDPDGRRFQGVEALVGTGATYTLVPASLLRGLGVAPHARATLRLGDGRHVEMDVGRARVRVGGRAEVTLVVFGEEGSEPLLGAYALEGLLLAADPVGRRLVPVPGLLVHALPRDLPRGGCGRALRLPGGPGEPRE